MVQCVDAGKKAKALSVSGALVSSYVNEAMDSVETVVVLGRNETIRGMARQAAISSSGTRYLVFGSAGFAMGQATLISMVALLCFSCSRRMADGAVSGFQAHPVGVCSSKSSAGRTLPALS